MRFVSGSLLFLLFFLVTRVIYYSFINIPYVFDDASSYISTANSILEGAPNFIKRTPGYPLFILFSYLMSDSVLCITYLQSFLTLVCSLFFIVAIFKSYPKILIPASISITIFTSSVVFLHFETCILTECVYVNLITLFISFLILAYKKQKMIFYFGMSLIAALLIYVRPTGLFLVPVFVLILIYILIHKLNRKFIYALLGPVIALYLVISAYNYSTLGQFTISTQGFSDMVCNTFTFIEKDSTFSKQANLAIEKAVLNKTKQNEILYIENTWDIKNIIILYLKYQSFDDDFWAELSKENMYRSKEFLEDCKQITIRTIKKHPDKYLKFLVVQYLHYFNSFDYENIASYPFLKSYKTCFSSRTVRYFKHRINRSGQQVFLKTKTISKEEAVKIIKEIKYKSWNNFMNWFSKKHHSLFRNYFWVILYFLVFIYSIILLIRSKLKSEVAWIVFIIGIMNILNLMLVSIVNIAMIRYNFVLHFTYYLIPAFLPLMIKYKKRREVNQKLKKNNSKKIIKNKQVRHQYKHKHSSQKRKAY
jgi:hypothetical protein